MNKKIIRIKEEKITEIIRYPYGFQVIYSYTRNKCYESLQVPYIDK